MPAAGLPAVPEPTLFIPAAARTAATRGAPTPLPVRYWPHLADGPVTQAVPLPLAGSPGHAGSGRAAHPGRHQPHRRERLHRADGRRRGPVRLAAVFRDQGHPQRGNQRRTSISPCCSAQPGRSRRDARGRRARAVHRSVADGRPAATAWRPRSTGYPSSSPSPPGYTPPATPPTAFPAAPTMLPATGPVELEDAGGAPYLTLQPTNPLSWPPLLRRSRPGRHSEPGPVQPGPGLPAARRRRRRSAPRGRRAVHRGDTRQRAAPINVPSSPITVQSFQDQPNPGLSALGPDELRRRPGGPVDQPGQHLRGRTQHLDRGARPAGQRPRSTPRSSSKSTLDGTAHLRFGDSTNGLFPASGTAFTAQYRVGNGTAGQCRRRQPYPVRRATREVVSCINPMAASGGVDPETADQIRRRAPQAFLTQERAITMTDYATVAEASPQVEDAAATLRWTGSWYTVIHHRRARRRR